MQVRHAGADVRRSPFPDDLLVPDERHGLPGQRYADASRAQVLGFIEAGTIDDGDPVLDLVLP